LPQDEIELAAAVHYSFLPGPYTNDWLDIDVRIRPHGVIGGDYCSIFPLSEQRLVLCMCDAVGHGVAAALFAARINSFVMANAHQVSDPCELVVSLNAFLCQRLAITGMYASFFTLFVDLEEMVCEYAGAAHPPAIYHDRRRNTCEALDSETTLLGLEDPLPVACAAGHHALCSGDRIIMYTDGLVEAKNGQAQQFGQAGLTAFSRRHAALGVGDFNRQLIQNIEDFAEHEIGDDMLLMTLCVK